jgi:IS5 family transposase
LKGFFGGSDSYSATWSLYPLVSVWCPRLSKSIRLKKPNASQQCRGKRRHQQTKPGADGDQRGADRGIARTALDPQQKQAPERSHCGTDGDRDPRTHVLGTRVIDQARRRVLDGEQVPTSDKIYSIFEPHTDLIKRGKVRAPVEFGHKVFLAESARGLITQYEVLRGNPADEVHVAPSLKRHRRIFRRLPALYGADRGFFSENNVAVCVRGGVATVSIPQRGGCKTPQRRAYERSPAFKQGQRFRAGIEGRISVLMRGRGMKRCRAEGTERFALFVRAAVLANNLMIIGELLTNRSRPRRKTNRRCLG